MNLLRKWFERHRCMPPVIRGRMEAWRKLDEPDLHEAHPLMRYVVVDVESSGLNLSSDHLIAIGAVTISDARVVYADSFYSVLRQEKASHDDNILVHHIGGTSQIEGEEPGEVLLRFLEFIGKAPLVGFHSVFDEIMIRKATRRYLGQEFDRTWIDLAWLAPAIVPECGGKLKSLDEWSQTFQIANFLRHDALADALATAQLFLILQYRASETGISSARGLVDAARQQEWLWKRGRPSI
jgi:DNA polymerase-3 subunit epsilon